MNRKENAPVKGQVNKLQNNNITSARLSDTSIAAQRARLLDYLYQNYRLTTIEARENLNIMHPAGRVMELRKAGLKITTIRRTDIDAQGHKHRVAEYVLLSGGEHE